MGRKNQSKNHEANKKSKRTCVQKKRRTPTADQKDAEDAAAQLDQVAQEFDGAAEQLQHGLEKLRGTLPELVAIGIRRDCLRRIRALADDGILDGLQRLAAAFDNLSPDALPESLRLLYRSAQLAVDRISRTFEVDPVYQPGESFTVTQEHLKDFDWSADCFGEFNFPAQVEILRSGWKAGNAVFVLPKAVRRGSPGCV